MRAKGSLRGRIVAAYTLLALTVCGLFAVVAYFAEQRVEQQFVERRIASIAKWALVRFDEGKPAALPPGFTFHVGPEIPVSMQTLTPGFHEFEQGDRTSMVLAGTSENGVRFVAMDDITDFELIERDVVISLFLGIALSALLAAILGRFTAGRVIKPVTALADSVRTNTLGDNAPVLMRNDEIGVLARAFSARTTELEHVLVRERLFTGDVSHELRTPLTIILGAAEVLSARLDERADLRPSVDRIHRTAKDTADRVSALLLLSRTPEALDAPRLSLRPLLEREIERSRAHLANKPVELSLDAPEGEVWVSARPELAGMAIGNLLRNACQYTQEGTITVQLKPGSLVIEDTGPGLPADVRDHLFERFERTRQDRRSGAGFGLAIVKRIADHLGWDLRLEDRPGGGTRFVLTFPLPGLTARSS
ncbi:MAG: sensor histidine kinase [Burkholderiaceae bacterium]